jgi:hypothetical protein
MGVEVGEEHSRYIYWTIVGDRLLVVNIPVGDWLFTIASATI